MTIKSYIPKLPHVLRSPGLDFRPSLTIRWWFVSPINSGTWRQVLFEAPGWCCLGLDRHYLMAGLYRTRQQWVTTHRNSDPSLKTVIGPVSQSVNYCTWRLVCISESKLSTSPLDGHKHNSSWLLPREILILMLMLLAVLLLLYTLSLWLLSYLLESFIWVVGLGPVATRRNQPACVQINRLTFTNYCWIAWTQWLYSRNGSFTSLYSAWRWLSICSTSTSRESSGAN